MAVQTNYSKFVTMAQSSINFFWQCKNFFRATSTCFCRHHPFGEDQIFSFFIDTKLFFRATPNFCFARCSEFHNDIFYCRVATKYNYKL